MRLVSRLLPLCVVLIGLCGSASQAQRRLSPIALAPAKGIAVIKVNWTVVKEDDRLRAMVKGNDFERVLGTLGIGSGEVSEFVVFSGLNTSPSGTSGLILGGSYRPQSVIKHIKSQGWTEELYKGRTVFRNPTDNSWMAPLRQGRLVTGSKLGVEGVIDVEARPGSGLTSKPPFSTALAKFANSHHPISFMMGVPSDYQNVVDVALKVTSVLMSFPGSGPLGFVMGKIGFPRLLGFSITRNGESFPVELLAMMKDPTSASILSGTFNVLQGLGLSVLSNRMPQSDQDVLKNISITRHGAMLSIKMRMRESDLPR